MHSPSKRVDAGSIPAGGTSVFAEVELGGFLVERVAQELLVAVGTQIHADLLVFRGEVLRGRAGRLKILKHLAESLELIAIEVLVGERSRVVGSVDFHLNHEAAVDLGEQFFPAEVTREMQHDRSSTQSPWPVLSGCLRVLSSR